MSPAGKLGARQARALATRRRTLRAAYALFCERGYAGTTMEAIAKEAGVAVQTLYFTFHTKAAMLDEVVGAAVVGFDAWAPPTGGMTEVDVGSPAALRRYHPWFDALAAAATAHAALEVFIDSGVEIMERAAPMTMVMRAAGEPEARAVYTLGEERRARAFRAVIQTLAKKPPGLRTGVTAARATDILLTVFSGETYQMFRERGWKPAQIRAWMIDALAHQLLAA